MLDALKQLSESDKPKAGSNEDKFQRNVGGCVKLEGKVVFKSKNGDVSISVDQSFTIDGKTYLVEVDSANMAKLLVGQYTLLCALNPDDVDRYVFLVVHYYKGYNPDRTMNNLREINRLVFKDKGMKFLVIHASQFAESGETFLELIKPVPAQCA